MLEKFTDLAAPAGGATASKGSIISEDLVVEGKITTRGAVEVRGQALGDVEGHRVVIGLGARVRGDIRGDGVSVDGRVDGDISARELVLSPSSQVQGSITYGEITVQSGATLNGQVRHAAPKPEAAPSAQPNGSSSE